MATAKTFSGWKTSRHFPAAQHPREFASFAGAASFRIMSTTPGLARTPEPPSYAVIFTSKRTEGDHGYNAMSQKMVELSAGRHGFLGMESVRGVDGVGITVSYWRDDAAIRAWKRDAEHQKAQHGGRASWYATYEIRIARVERAYGFPRDARTPPPPASLSRIT